MRHSARILRRNGGFTLVEWLAGAMAVVMVLALVVPVLVRASRQNQVLRCRTNLRTLHQGQAAAPKGSAPLGKAFWTRLEAKEFLRCPLAPKPGDAGCDYLGPAADPAGLGEKEPLGCDDFENHGTQGQEGGNVLLKSGEVHTDQLHLWSSAVRGGKCRP